MAVESNAVIAEEKKQFTVDREKVCPMLVRVFYNIGSHNQMMDYMRGHTPSNELQIYTWKDASLKELTNLVREVNPDARAKGTYFEFALVVPDKRSNGYSLHKIGTTCSGRKSEDDQVTLHDRQFVVGDYIDIAILPHGRHFGGDYAGGGGRRDQDWARGEHDRRDQDWTRGDRDWPRRPGGWGR